MSYILDALKRSEEERNRGHVPTLQTVYYEDDDRNFEFLHTTAGRLLLAALVLAVAALLYSNRQPLMGAYDRAFGGPDTIVTENRVAETNIAETRVARTDQAVQAVPSAEAQTSSSAEAAQSVPQPPPQPVQPVASVEPSVVQPAKPSRVDSAQPVVTGTAALSKSVNTGTSVQVAESQPVQAVPEPATTPEQPTSVAEQTGAAQVVAAAAVIPTNDAPAKSSETKSRDQREVKTKHDLPADVKRSIPKLSLSVVSYAANPQKRFVMVDSEIYYEGEEMTENLIIEAITPDGPIVTWRGHEFLLQP